MQLTIFGCGYSGRVIAAAFKAAGFAAAGTVRRPEQRDLLRESGIEPLFFDGAGLDDGQLTATLSQTTHLLQSVPPGRDGDPVLAAFAGRLRHYCPRLEWIGYLSTVGVYGDHDGNWVDEETPLSPESGRSALRAAAEAGWRQAGEEAGTPVALLRLPGIYGPGRNAFVNLADGSARRIVKPGHVSNRVRVEDIAGAALFLAQGGHAGAWNVTDGMPAPPQDVVREAARLMGVAPPQPEDFATAEISAMARSFYAANRRVSNLKLRSAGFSFAFPDYRMSLAQLWTSGKWRAEQAI